MRRIRVFDPDRVINSFGLDDILRIQEDPFQELDDVLSNLDQDDLDIEKWLSFWSNKNVPWAMTKNGNNTVSVWKRNELI